MAQEATVSTVLDLVPDVTNTDVVWGHKIDILEINKDETSEMTKRSKRVEIKEDDVKEAMENKAEYKRPVEVTEIGNIGRYIVIILILILIYLNICIYVCIYYMYVLYKFIMQII